MAEQKSTALVNLLNRPFVVTIAAGILTAVLAPYLIEKTKNRIDTQNKIVAQQFEVVETLTEMSFRYYIAAEFVKLDFYQGQPDKKLLEKHLQDYDQIAKETLSGLLVASFKARMYFDDMKMYKKLQESWGELAALDAQIVHALNLQNNTPSKLEKDTARWTEISYQLTQYLTKIEGILNSLYQRIGKTDKSGEGYTPPAMSIEPTR